MRIFLVSLFVSLFLFIVPVYSKTLWKDRNIYASGTNLNTGDIIVVNIEDMSQLRFNVTFNSDNSYNIISNPDANITGFLPKISSDKKIRSGDKSDFSGKGSFNISIASQVTAVNRDGKLTINGIREYSINGKINRFRLSGVVDPELIKGRTVLSKDIANFRLEIAGLQERGIINLERKIQEGGSASSQLTEEEKQEIISDYLNRMLRELTR